MANEVLIPVKYVVDGSDLDKAARQLGVVTSEEKKLEAEMNDVANAAKRQTTEFHKAGNAGEKAAKDTEKQYSMLGNTMGSLTGIIAGVFAVDQLLSFGKEVLNITAEFQKYKAVLTNSLGSASAAASAMAMIQEIAAKTPFSVAQLTESYVKLVNQGFKPTAEQLISMGDLAASTGKEFDQLAEAILDAQTGEFERLKEFGIRAKKEGENITFTFKGVETTVKNTSTSIQDYLVGLGQIEGVSGSMAAISETLGGKISNLGDAFDQLFLTLGDGVNGPGVAVIDWLGDLAKGLTIIFTDPVKAAQKQAASTMTDFEAAMVKALQGIADKTKAAGGDVDEAVNANIAKVRDKLMADLDKAQSRLKNIKKGIEDSPLGLAPHTLKTALAETAGRVALLTGQLEALKTLGDKVRKDGAGDDKDQLGTIEAIRAKMKEITKTRDEQVGLTQKQANAYNQELKQLQKQLDALTKIEEAKTKRSPAVHLKYIFEEEAAKNSSKTKLEILKDEAEAEKAIREQSTRNLLEELDKREAYQRRLVDEGINFALFAASAYATFQRDNTDERIQNLQDASEREQQLAGDNAQAKELIEKEYNNKIQAERVKQAKLEQNMALFQIAVDTASSIIKTGSELGYPAAIPFQIMAGVTGAIQAALVKSQPIPRYAKGTRSVMGGTPGEDSVLAMLMPGERVVTTEKNRTLSPAFDVLTDSKRSPQFWNKTLMEIEKLGVFTPPNLSDLPPVIGGNYELLAALSEQNRILKNLPIHQTYFDERGVTEFTRKQNSRIQRLNKHYGF